MSDESKRILTMLSEGKINVEEAEKLLAALKEGHQSSDESLPTKIKGAKRIPQFLHVAVEPKSEKGDRVNVKVPFKLVKAGMKLASLVPQDVQVKVDGAMKEKGVDFDFSKLNSNNVEEILETFNDFSVDVETEDERVRVFCD